MNQLFSQFSYSIAALILLSVVGVHLSRKNSSCIFFYIVQSLAVSLLLFIPAVREKDVLLMVAAILTMSIKAVGAPFFFYRLIKRHELTFSANTYLSLPLTLIGIAL